MHKQSSNRDIKHYFEYSNAGIEVVQDGLQELSFGEFLVEKRAISRYQLFQALQMQDRHPGVRLGECIAALGYMPYSAVQGHLSHWNRVNVVEA